MGDIDAGRLHNVLDRLGKEIRDINEANGWDGLAYAYFFEPEGKYLIPSKLALLHSEVSEALEAYRKGDRDNFAEEMADVFIRLLDTTYPLGIDLAAATLAKLAKNRTRGFRHGGKRV